MLHGRKVIGTVAYLGGLPAVLEEFAWSLGNLMAFSTEELCRPNERIALDRTPFSLHTVARNVLASRFLGDWLLMLDTDHAFEPDLLVRMLHRMNTLDLDVMAGVYQQKNQPFAPVLYGWQTDPANPERGGMRQLGGFIGPDVQEVAGAGAGCLLVRREVFDKIKNDLNEQPFDRIEQGGEDLAFFHRLRRLKIKSYCDRRVECHHLQVRSTLMSDFRPDPSDLAPIDPATGLVPEQSDFNKHSPDILAPVGA